MTNLAQPVHPGKQLQDRLDELEMSGKEFASHIGVPPNRVNDIVRGRRGITADTALRLSCFFGTTAEFWMNLQTDYELKITEAAEGKQIRSAVKPRAA